MKVKEVVVWEANRPKCSQRARTSPVPPLVWTCIQEPSRSSVGFSRRGSSTAEREEGEVKQQQRVSYVHVKRCTTLHCDNIFYNCTPSWFQLNFFLKDVTTEKGWIVLKRTLRSEADVRLHLKSHRDESGQPIQATACCSHSANPFKLSTTLHGWFIKHRLITSVDAVGVRIREAHTANKRCYYLDGACETEEAKRNKQHPLSSISVPLKTLIHSHN